MDELNNPNDAEVDRISTNEDANGFDVDSAAETGEEPGNIFRSSLCGMFQESRSSKTDACAAFCCGIYLWQRNQDLLMRVGNTGEGVHHDDAQSSPTSSITKELSLAIARRPSEVAVVVLVAATIIMWSLDDPTTDHRFSTIVHSIVALLIVYLVYRVFKFQSTRKEFRKQLAIAEYHRRRNAEGSENENENDDDPDLAVFLQHRQQEIFQDGAHDICGCARNYAWWFDKRRRRSNDRDDRNNNVDGDVDDDEKNYRQGFCFNAWKFLDKLFCGMLCGCHLQLFGMCAIAQESRHLQDALPPTTRPGLWQRDYITMQPWSEYYPSILRLRLSNETQWLPHFQALSRLSRHLLLATTTILLFVTLLFLLPIRFSKWQVLILYGTILQPCVFLFFVHWLWNRLDLSFDAVVKYFACGFFICTSSALAYEFSVSKVAEQFLTLINILGSEALEVFELDTYQRGHVEDPLWYQLTMALITASVNAFFVAGMTEEICKYLCFWMVEHPDLELRDRVILPSSCAHRETDDHLENSKNEDTETTRLLSQDRSISSSQSDPEEQVIFAPTATLVSLGEAITVAMITVALGFACAENFLYVFIYTPPGLSAEIDTLYARCLFPIHPITAALQSIGVCRRDLEKDSSVGIGKILLPAWLLHGCFDAVLMAYAPIRKILDHHNSESPQKATDPPIFEPGGGETVDADQGVSIFRVVMIIPFISMVYFLNESYLQRERLEQLDKADRMQS